MRNTTPRFSTYNVQHAHTGEVVSTHPTRREANAAKNAAADHALRVRGGKPIDLPPSMWLLRAAEKVAQFAKGTTR